MPQRTAPTSNGERELMLRRYLPLVRRVARCHLGAVSAPVGLDDLVAWGTLGLLDALDRYDPSRAALFSTYARFRIRGAILDQLRELDWVPRSVRERAAALEQTARLLEARLGRPAKEEELAAALGLSLGDYRTLVGSLAPVGLVSLDDPVCGGGDVHRPPDRAESGPLGALLRREQLALLTDAVRRLPDREQLLLSLYYRDELTMKEVGSVLGLTESRVSQLHAQAVIHLRAQLHDRDPLVAQAG